jgi:serine/threonine-protein kinase
VTTLTATGQVLADRYKLIRWVGGGSMGEVWEATDTRMDRPVAVKVLRPAHANDPVALERFKIEARLGAQLDHPGIAKVHDVNVDGRSGEPPWMVQEYVAGEPLTDLLRRDGALDPRLAVSIVAQVAEAAHAAHRVGVVHRDLTPRNLLIAADGSVKVTDFGIARSDSAAPLTKAGHVIGTPAYLSPEQVRGSTASPASDVYTLGVVLYECLSGRRPFDGSNPIEVARAHLEQVPPPLPTVIPGPLRAVVIAALAKEPENRPAAADLARRLHAAIAPPRPGAAFNTEQMTVVRPLADVTRPAPAAGQPLHAAGRPLHAAPLGPRRAAASQAPTVAQRVSASAQQAFDRALPVAQRAWAAAGPEVDRVARATWNYLMAMRVGVVGAALVLVAVLAVVSSRTG